MELMKDNIKNIRALESFTMFMLTAYPDEFNTGLPVNYNEVLKVAEKLLSKEQ